MSNLTRNTVRRWREIVDGIAKTVDEQVRTLLTSSECDPTEIRESLGILAAVAGKCEVLRDWIDESVMMIPLADTERAVLFSRTASAAPRPVIEVDPDPPLSTQEEAAFAHGEESIVTEHHWPSGEETEESKLAREWEPKPDPGRLVMDLNISETSPVVTGTWVTVEHIVSLVVHGHSWSDILQTHPEICEDDIRAALAHVVDEDAKLREDIEPF